MGKEGDKKGSVKNWDTTHKKNAVIKEEFKNLMCIFVSAN